MRDRTTALVERLTISALWAVGLSPAFFAVVVHQHLKYLPIDPMNSGSAKGIPDSTAPWRLHVGEFYAVGTFVLLASVLTFSLAAPRPTRKRSVRALVVTGIGVYLGPLLSGLVGGHGGATDWHLWIAPLTIAALFGGSPVDPRELLRRLRTILRVYTWGSLGALVVAPGWALANDVPIVNFRIPGLGDSRLIGLTGHPILLGALAAVTLALELAPLWRGRLWLWHSGAAGVVLVLAQCRTSWLAVIVGLALLYRRDVPRRIHPLLTRGLAMGVVVCVFPLFPRLLARFSELASDNELTSLHGRTDVWAMAMSVFRANPLWGYGPTVFTDPASPAHGYSHAENQLFQTLSTSGLVGAVGLLLFVVALVWAAARTSRTSAGLGWALVIITLITCVSEPALQSDGFNPFLLMVMLDITVLLVASQSAELSVADADGLLTPTPPVPGPARRDDAPGGAVSDRPYHVSR